MSKGFDREIRPIDALEVAQKAGELSAAGFRFAVVVARFNQTLTDALARSAVGALQACGAKAEAIEVVRVPGAYEIPVAVERVLQDPSIDAVIALGVVVEGETQHAQMIIETTGSPCWINRLSMGDPSLMKLWVRARGNRRKCVVCVSRILGVVCRFGCSRDGSVT